MRLVLFFLVVCLVTTPAAAEKPTAGSIKAVENLAKVINLKGQVGGGFEAMMPMVKGMSERMKLSPEETRALESTFRSWYVEDFDHQKILEETVRLYATTFTEEELIIMTEFYASPVGQKALALMPDLLKQSVVMAMMEGKAKQEQLKARLDRLFTERVTTVPGASK